MNSSDPVDNPLVDEVRKLASAVAGKAQQAIGQFREQYPEVSGHLTAAGSELASAAAELAAAYRAAVAGHERRWSAPGPADTERIDLDG